MSKPTMYERVICAIGSLRLTYHNPMTKEEARDYLTLGFEALEEVFRPASTAQGSKPVEKTCANCLHWSKHDPVLRANIAWGVCEKTRMREASIDNAPTRAIALPAVGFSAILETAPTHSCSMWEAKE